MSGRSMMELNPKGWTQKSITTKSGCRVKKKIIFLIILIAITVEQIKISN